MSLRDKRIYTWRIEKLEEVLENEVIAYAKDITINRLGREDDAYTYTILKSWHDKGIRTLDDVKIAEKVYEAQKTGLDINVMDILLLENIKRNDISREDLSAAIENGELNHLKKKKEVRINMAFAPDLLAWIKTTSRQQGISASEFVNIILRKEMEKGEL